MANLIHDVISGKLVAGVLYFWDKTPMIWFYKKLVMPKMATYGTEYVSGTIFLNRSLIVEYL